MGKEIKLKLIRIALFILLLVPVFMAGFYSGNFAGNQAVKRMFTGSRGIFFLLLRPAHQFFQVYRMLNSDSDIIRLSGYYSMLDNNIIDDEFLKERFENERGLVIRRTIIWLMGFSDNFERIKVFCTNVYDESPVEVKREILRIFRKRDREYYQKFVKSKKAESLLPDD